MMRKIILGIVLILLIALGINLVINGMLGIQSMSKVEESSKELKAKIEESNRLIDTEYPKKLEDLQTANNNTQKAKKEYLEYVNKSSSEQIMAAKTLKSYAIEFLWTKLGTHAREEGVNITFEIGTGGSTLNFIVDGSYIAITNFVYAIENDSDLDFRIQNFKLLPHQDEILEATFSVSGVTIQGNTATEKKYDTPTSSPNDSTTTTENSNANPETTTSTETSTTR